ncbi:MAG: hypothetical protein HUT38_03355 [Candidatus Paceibacter sp.]|nr:hypothetical protein [Candidatus Paceibacter sp.]
MDEIKTWTDFGALTKEQLDAFTPEELETLKTSIADNEAKTADERKRKDEEAAKNKELAENYKIRAEKAESKVKDKGEGLSDKDIFTLTKSDIDEEDFDEIKNYASFKKISVSEALKDKTLQSIISDRKEERQSAAVAAANAKSPRGTSKVSPETLLEKARQGQMPEKDEDIEKLVEARINSKKRG